MQAAMVGSVQMRRILVVDDQVYLVGLIKMTLEQAGYEVTTARNGVEALAEIDKCQPDVLITDIIMPEMSGDELCAEISRKLPDRAFPIIVLTSRIEDKYRRLPDLYNNLVLFEKPIGASKLLTKLSELLP